MALFPANPSDGATANVNGYQFTFNSTDNVWNRTQSFTGSLAVTTISASGNANVGNLGTVGLITATGNITGGNLIGPLANGNSNVNIPAVNGNINFSSAGNANILVVTGTGANLTGTLNVSGNTTFSGTGQRILGDFSTIPTSSRTIIQDKTTNNGTSVPIIPNGTNANASIVVFNSSNTANAAYGSIAIDNNVFQVGTSNGGTSPYVPMTFSVGGSEAARFDTSRNFMIGTTTSSGKLTVVNSGTANTATVFSTGNISGNPNTTANMWKQAAFVSNGGFGGGIALNNGGGSNDGFLMYLTSTPSQLNIQYGSNGGNTGSAGVTLTSTGTSWSAFSDERLKTDLQPIANAIQKSSSLRTVTGRYKTDPEGTVRNFLLAQDVLPVVPSAVSTNEDGMLLLSRDELIPLLFATVNELSAQVAELKTEVNNLKNS